MITKYTPGICRECERGIAPYLTICSRCEREMAEEEFARSQEEDYAIRQSEGLEDQSYAN